MTLPEKVHAHMRQAGLLEETVAARAGVYGMEVIDAVLSCGLDDLRVGAVRRLASALDVAPAVLIVWGS